MTLGNQLDITSGACCAQAVASTPLCIGNRHGLESISYRIGTYRSFLESMIRAVARDPRLIGWTARATDDYAVAILSMWAAVGEVLTFYQERIANEAYLSTAVQRASVLRLIDPLGYRPSPGLAAEALLALEIEKGKQAALSTGLRVQSVPEPGETPQVFESTEALDADARRNSVRIYPQPVPYAAILKRASSGILLEESDLGPGAQLVAFDRQELIVEDKLVTAVEKTLWGHTLTWSPAIVGDVSSAAELWPWTRKARLFGFNAPEQYLAVAPVVPPETPTTIGVSTPDSLVTARGDASIAGIESAETLNDALANSVNAPLLGGAGANPMDADFAGGTSADQPLGAFGNSADFDLSGAAGGSSAESRAEEQPDVVWQSKVYAFKDGIITGSGRTSLNLDAIYDDLVEGVELLLLQNPSARAAALGLSRKVQRLKVIGVRQEAVTGEATGAVAPLQDTVTQVDVEGELERDAYDARYVSIYMLRGGEPIRFSQQGYADTLGGAKCCYLKTADLELESDPSGADEELDALFPKGLRVILSDRVQPATAAEVVEASIDSEYSEHVRIALDQTLPVELDRESTVLHANVVRASHGETVSEEVLGSGDASRPLQSFELSDGPVTHVSDPSASHGAASSLAVRVNDVEWTEVETLHGQQCSARIYTTSVDDDGVMTVRFGDGITGARVPTGKNNIVAAYRRGIGLAGNVSAGCLKTLLDRPLGLRKAMNPAAADGGAAEETRDSVRSNAPNCVRTFDRVVSLRDFADAAIAYSGIAKACATHVRRGGHESVLVIVAGDSGSKVSAKIQQSLRAYLDARRDPNRILEISSHYPIRITVEGIVQVDSDYSEERVVAAAKVALLEHFAFDRRDLGQPVHLSDVYRDIQSVEGVKAVRIYVFCLKQTDVNATSTEQTLLAGTLSSKFEASPDSLLGGTGSLVAPRLDVIPIQPVRFEVQQEVEPGRISIGLPENLVSRLDSRPDQFVLHSGQFVLQPGPFQILPGHLEVRPEVAAAAATRGLFWRIRMAPDELATLEETDIQLLPGEVGS